MFPEPGEKLTGDWSAGYNRPGFRASLCWHRQQTILHGVLVKQIIGADADPWDRRIDKYRNNRTHLAPRDGTARSERDDYFREQDSYCFVDPWEHVSRMERP
ncbi:MAG: hypothetical protein ABSG68_21380 [Thermoguttaceae bacterium]